MTMDRSAPLLHRGRVMMRLLRLTAGPAGLLIFAALISAVAAAGESKGGCDGPNRCIPASECRRSIVASSSEMRDQGKVLFNCGFDRLSLLVCCPPETPPSTLPDRHLLGSATPSRPGPALSGAPAGNWATHTPESIPDRHNLHSAVTNRPGSPAQVAVAGNRVTQSPETLPERHSVVNSRPGTVSAVVSGHRVTQAPEVLPDRYLVTSTTPASRPGPVAPAAVAGHGVLAHQTTRSVPRPSVYTAPPLTKTTARAITTTRPSQVTQKPSSVITHRTTQATTPSTTSKPSSHVVASSNRHTTTTHRPTPSTQSTRTTSRPTVDSRATTRAPEKPSDTRHSILEAVPFSTQRATTVSSLYTHASTVGAHPTHTTHTWTSLESSSTEASSSHSTRNPYDNAPVRTHVLTGSEVHRPDSRPVLQQQGSYSKQPDMHHNIYEEEAIRPSSHAEVERQPPSHHHYQEPEDHYPIIPPTRPTRMPAGTPAPAAYHTDPPYEPPRRPFERPYVIDHPEDSVVQRPPPVRPGAPFSAEEYDRPPPRPSPRPPNFSSTYPGANTVGSGESGPVWPASEHRPPPSRPGTRPQEQSYELVQHHNYRLLPQDICGTTAAGPNRIINGQNVTLGQFPWMALLGYKSSDAAEDFVSVCGGTLISWKYVLTAAHCLKSNVRVVRLGEHVISTQPDCDQDGLCADPVEDVEIELKIPHPSYSKPYLKNDIGLIRMRRAQPRLFSSYVRPICLPLEPEQPRPGRKLIIAGWGTTRRGSKISSDVLQVTMLPEIGQVECSEAQEDDVLRTVISSQMCTSASDHLSNACHGDSGGPLMDIRVVQGLRLHDEPVLVQLGIVSLGADDCGVSGTPSIYTRVSSFTDWILDTLRD